MNHDDDSEPAAEAFSRSTLNEGRGQQHDESSSYTSERRLFTRQRGDSPDWGRVRRDLILERPLYSRDRERPRSRSPDHLNHNKRVKYSLQKNITDDLDFENVLATLKLLMVMEEYLGSLGPKIMELMTTAITMEKDKRNSSKSLLSNIHAVVLLEAAKEKLKGAVQAGILPKQATSAASFAVMRTAATLHEANKHLQSRQQLRGNDTDNLSTPENNGKDDALHKYEKEHALRKKEPTEEIEASNNSVSDQSKNLDDERSRQIENPDEIQDLGLPELEVLLKNFKNLPYDEQQALKLYLLNLKQGLPDTAKDLLESFESIIDEPVKIITAKNYKPQCKDGETSAKEKMTTNLEEKTSYLEWDREKRIDYLECKSDTTDLKGMKIPISEGKKSIKMEWIQTALERHEQKKEEEKKTGIAEGMQCEESRNVDDEKTNSEEKISYLELIRRANSKEKKKDYIDRNKPYLNKKIEEQKTGTAEQKTGTAEVESRNVAEEKTNKKEMAPTFPTVRPTYKTTIVTADTSQDSEKNRYRWVRPDYENKKVTCSTKKGKLKIHEHPDLVRNDDPYPKWVFFRKHKNYVWMWRTKPFKAELKRERKKQRAAAAAAAAAEAAAAAAEAAAAGPSGDMRSSAEAGPSGDV